MSGKVKGLLSVDFNTIPLSEINEFTGKFAPVFVLYDYNASKDTPDVQEILSLFYSNAEIKRLIKQGGVKLAYGDAIGHFLYVGKEKKLIIVENDLSIPVWWAAWCYDYFFSVKPKHLDWEVIK